MVLNVGSNVKSVTSGLLWTYAERITAQFITIVVTIILARIIAPAEYGLISIVSIFISIANSFVISGFGNSLIQKKNADELDFSTVFYFSVVLATITYFIIFIAAASIASFYDMPQLVIVFRVMGIRIPVAAINSVQHAYISKKMEFKKFFFSTLGGTVVSGIVGIILAYNGFGIWALVAQYLTNTIINTFVLWFTAGWRPKYIFSFQRMKSLFSYGWKIMCVGVMTTLYSNLRNLVIGKRYSSADLAYSEKGEQFASTIAGNINSSITKVLFPVLSNYQDDRAQLKRMVGRSINVGTYVLFPVLFGFAVVADSFVSVFMTDEWLGCVPYIRIMCAVYALQPLQTASLQCIKALGKSSLYLSLDIIKKVVGLVVLIVSILFFDDVFYIVLGAIVIELFSVFILVPVNTKIIDYSVLEQVKDILPTVFLTAMMVIGVIIFNNLFIVEGLLKLVLDIFVGIILYLFASMMTNNKSLYYILHILKSLARKN